MKEVCDCSPCPGKLHALCCSNSPHLLQVDSQYKTVNVSTFTPYSELCTIAYSQVTTAPSLAHTVVDLP